jgi:uncharacterized DUF497 family protein
MSQYDWDLDKATASVRHHGVPFTEAETVANSPLARWTRDTEHSDVEDRLRIVGWSNEGRLLVVIVSVSGARPRIISARRAMKRERYAYEARP